MQISNILYDITSFVYKRHLRARTRYCSMSGIFYSVTNTTDGFYNNQTWYSSVPFTAVGDPRELIWESLFVLQVIKSAASTKGGTLIAATLRLCTEILRRNFFSKPHNSAPRKYVQLQHFEQVLQVVHIKFE